MPLRIHGPLLMQITINNHNDRIQNINKVHITLGFTVKLELNFYLQISKRWNAFEKLKEFHLNFLKPRVLFDPND